MLLGPVRGVLGQGCLAGNRAMLMMMMMTARKRVARKRMGAAAVVVARGMALQTEKVLIDGVERDVCKTCDHVYYENPKLVSNVVATIGGDVQENGEEGEEEQFLLVRRAIEPRRGYWTHCGGFLEHGESLRTGAAREAMEEAHARVSVQNLMSLYEIAHIGQVLAFHTGRLENPEEIGPTNESLEAALFTWDQVPWSELAFPATSWAFFHYRRFQRFLRGEKQARDGQDGDDGLLPYSIPLLPGRDKPTTHAWFNGQEMVYDRSWIDGSRNSRN